MQILFEFNSSFDVKCQECQQNQEAKLANLVTKDDFNNFTIIEQKINSGTNNSKECHVETYAEIANTIKNNLADVPFIQQFAKKQEEEDKIKQKNNFLMFGLPESPSDSVVTSVKDDYNKLKYLYKNLMTLSPTDIVSIVRLDSKNADINRPLLIR